ncbi:hypothetical protein NQ317_011767 [Molorchus minor]|uniref:Transmembrane 9 superfamily member n=1 Tax=Molorchus minor TaxID=1323400 RepID=A0ABQ9J451_9CUCU|nr:hypothetical protein NQ317_011767 [Molorchus minor]
MYVNRLNTEESVIPYEYHHFDFCLPDGEAKSPVENLGQVLFGERIRPSPYKISFMKNETFYGGIWVEAGPWRCIPAPRKGMLLSVLLGSGVQVFCMTLVTLAFACLGFLSPANRGALMTCAMVLYVLLGSPAGCVSARIYKSFGGEKWKSNVLLTSLLAPG